MRIKSFSPQSLLRDVREEPRFVEQMNSLGIDPEHRDKVMEAVVFSVARHPEEFRQLAGTPLRILTFECYKNAPAINVLFAFTERRVSLLDAYFEPEDEDDSF